MSRATGQFWTAKASRGSVTFRGLYPGSYDLQVPGVGNYLPARLHVKAKVRSGHVAFGSARLTKRGAWVTGTAVDANNPSQPLPGAAVRLFDADGNQVATATADKPRAPFTLDGQLADAEGHDRRGRPGAVLALPRARAPATASTPSRRCAPCADPHRPAHQRWAPSPWRTCPTTSRTGPSAGPSGPRSEGHAMTDDTRPPERTCAQAHSPASSCACPTRA